MADIHVLNAAENGDSLRLVFHFSVPDLANEVGVNYPTALVASGQGGSTTLAEGDGPGQISSAEKALIEAGEVLEYPRSLSRGELVSGGPALAQVQATIRYFYTRDKADRLARLQTALRFFGAAFDEVAP